MEVFSANMISNQSFFIDLLRNLVKIQHNTISISKDNEAASEEAPEAYIRFEYVEDADDDANKVIQRPEAHPAGERIVNKTLLYR
jgi:hypothetical protein